MQFLEDNNRFYALDPSDGKEIGEMTYTSIGDNKISIDHTYVDPNYRGQRIAEKLFDLIIEKAKREEKLIIPVCSYAVKQFSQREDIQALKTE